MASLCVQVLWHPIILLMTAGCLGLLTANKMTSFCILLDALETWERTRQMSFNAMKCSVMHILYFDKHRSVNAKSHRHILNPCSTLTSALFSIVLERKEKWLTGNYLRLFWGKCFWQKKKKNHKFQQYLKMLFHVIFFRYGYKPHTKWRHIRGINTWSPCRFVFLNGWMFWGYLCLR